MPKRLKDYRVECWGATDNNNTAEGRVSIFVEHVKAPTPFEACQSAAAIWGLADTAWHRGPRPHFVLRVN